MASLAALSAAGDAIDRGAGDGVADPATGLPGYLATALSG